MSTNRYDDDGNSRGRGDSATGTGEGDSPRTGEVGWQPSSSSERIIDLRSQYGTYTGDGSDFSPENPYYKAMGSATTKEELAALRQEAIQWETNRVDYNQQLADQRALRDEDRFYNSPAQQIARERAAGLNPDLQGGTAYSGGSGSGGSATPPQMASTDLEGMPTPYETADRFFAGMSSVAGLISSVTSMASGAVTMYKELGTMEDYFSMSNSAARSAQVAANVSEQTEAAQISAKNIEAANRRAIAVGDFASGLLSGDESEDQIREIVSQYYPNDATFADEVIRHSATPSVQAKYNEMKLAAKKARAENEAAPYEFLKQVREKQYEYEGYKLFADTNTENLRMSITSNLVVDDHYIRDMSDTIAGQAEYDNEATEQRTRELRRDVKSFLGHIKFVDERLKDIDKEIEEIDQQVEGPARNVLLKALRIQRAQLEYLNTEQLANAYGMVAKIIEGIESNNYLTSFGGYSNILSEKWYDSGLKKYTHWTLNGYREDPGKIEGIFDQIVELLSKVIK